MVIRNSIHPENQAYHGSGFSKMREFGALIGLLDVLMSERFITGFCVLK